MDPVILSCAELSTREINTALAALPDGACARVLEPRGRHNLAVGLSNRVGVDIEGNAGYFIGGLGQGPDVVVSGFVGWSVGENLMAGSVRVRGNASECAGASRGVAPHPDRPGHQVLADRPADEAAHHHVGPLAEAADEVARVALDVDPHSVAEADREVVAAPGLEHPGAGAVGQRGQRGVDLAGGQLRAAQDHRLHMWISSGMGSKTRAAVMPGSPARAWYSEAMAT